MQLASFAGVGRVCFLGHLKVCAHLVTLVMAVVGVVAPQNQEAYEMLVVVHPQ